LYEFIETINPKSILSQNRSKLLRGRVPTHSSPHKLG